MTTPFSFTRRVQGAALAAIVVLGLAACGTGPSTDPSNVPNDPTSGSASQTGQVVPLTPVKGGVLVTSAVDPGSDIDPVTVSSSGGTAVVDTVGEKLILIDADNKPAPRLATEWSVGTDNLTWTVKIRSGVKFNDGTPLTPADVAATFNRLIAADSTSPAKGALRIVKEVTVNGDSVDFVLSQPFSDFPVLLAGSNTQILPASYKVGTWTQSFVGTGAFEVESYHPGQQVTFTRNPDYWNPDVVYLDGIELKFFKDSQARVLALQSGEIDGLFGEPVPAALTSALNPNDYTIQTIPGSGFSALVFRVDQAPVDDVKVRQAIAWALDREAIIETAFGGNAALGNDTIYSPLFPVRPQGLEQRDVNLGKVKELLGDKVIEFAITTSPSEESYATVIQQQLNATGNFKVTLDILSNDAYYADGEDSPWLNAPVTLTYWAGRPSPSQFINYIYRAGSGWNASKYSNPALEKLSDQYDATVDPTERQKIVDQIGKIQWEDVPVVIVGFSSYQQFLAKGVHVDITSGDAFTNDWKEQ
ncbi:MAG: ABC transporter substrate-binding protein [Propionibacteriaceae bacterium]|nr:ABC transporter substrate-binding protein [Propionibacteriaceae bacterium]